MSREQTDRAHVYHAGQRVIGIYKGYAKHFGFLIMEDWQEDIYIGKEYRGNALHNDKVEVEVLPRSGRGKWEGRIIKVLEHANETIVGTFSFMGKFGIVEPDDERIGTDVYIAPADMAEAKSGAKVLVRMTRWPENRRMAEGVIEEILGYEGDVGLDINLIIANHHLPKIFPQEALAEAEAVAREPLSLEGRRDYRQDPVITVDGADAKDLDDAVYCRKNEDGTFTLWVHIADVSHYVRPGSAIDKEAYRRGTSVYLADRVIPMLPVVLSNGMCSLNEGEDRYTMSVEMKIDRHGKVIASEVGPGMIRSARRFHYAEVKQALFDGIVPDDIAPHLPMLQDWLELSEILIHMREQRGALGFEFPEFKVLLDQEGHPLRIVRKDRTMAERMIEEAMLIANETIARFISQENRTAIYRVHRNPDRDKLHQLENLLEALGIPVRLSEEPSPKEIQQLLHEAEKQQAALPVEVMTLRALPQAYYDTTNWGHFGLASECYTHYTSPIRRYPDLEVHRLIREVLAGKRQPSYRKSWLGRVAEQSSMAERRAVEAERETVELKRTEYMLPFVGEAFSATVSGITDFGIFVTLENGAEGLVHRDWIGTGTGYFDESRYVYCSHQGEVLYRLGDEVRVTLVKADLERRTLDFVFGEFENFAEVEKKMASREQRRHKQKRIKLEKTTNPKKHKKRSQKKHTQRKQKTKKKRR